MSKKCRTDLFCYSNCFTKSILIVLMIITGNTSIHFPGIFELAEMAMITVIQVNKLSDLSSLSIC